LIRAERAECRRPGVVGQADERHTQGLIRRHLGQTGFWSRRGRRLERRCALDQPTWRGRRWGRQIDDPRRDPKQEAREREDCAPAADGGPAEGRKPPSRQDDKRRNQYVAPQPQTGGKSPAGERQVATARERRIALRSHEPATEGEQRRAEEQRLQVAAIR